MGVVCIQEAFCRAIRKPSKELEKSGWIDRVSGIEENVPVGGAVIVNFVTSTETRPTCRSLVVLPPGRHRPY